MGFFAGLFGAGGSAVGTPLLHLVGVPAFVALASPLPTAVPVALASSRAYWRRGFVERRILVEFRRVGAARHRHALVLGHVDWQVVLAYAVLPAAYLGARLAIRANPGWLAGAYGVVLALLAVGLLLSGGDAAPEPHPPGRRAQGPLIRAGRDFCGGRLRVLAESGAREGAGPWARLAYKP